MHLTLKMETTRPPGSNSLQQQDRFDAFVHEFNTERPHEALGMKCPAQLYTASPRRYDGLPELTYPFHDRDILVTACGRLCLHRKRINTQACWPVKSSASRKSTTAFGSPASCATISDTRPGAENPATSRQPVRHEVVTHVLGTTCHLCVRAGQRTGWLAWSDSNYGIHLDRNPFELPREFLPDLGKRKFRDGSSVSCAFASPQLRQARGKSCPPEGPN